MHPTRRSCTIYVQLLGEPEAVWRPVEAIERASGCFEIISSESPDDGELWEFSPGDIVRCERRKLSQGEALAAVLLVKKRQLNEQRREELAAEHEQIWCVAANVVNERPYGPGGAEIRYGTKHFSPGTKLYIIDWSAGALGTVVAIGRHRGSKRYCRMRIDARYITNLRAKLVYSPTVLGLALDYYADHHRNPLNEGTAISLCGAIPQWNDDPS